MQELHDYVIITLGLLFYAVGFTCFQLPYEITTGGLAGAGKPQRIKKGYHAALVLDVCFAVLAFLVIETLHTQISSLFLGKDGTALAYQVSGDYMS